MASSPTCGSPGAEPCESFDSPSDSLLTVTENKSATFSSSSNPSIDFFFQVVPDTPTPKLLSLLAAAWQHDPLTALKLVFQLRGVRGTGKSQKDAFMHCASWIHEKHPSTLLANLYLVPKFGCFKDLLEIVLREVEGPEETEKRERERKMHNQKVLAAKSGKRRRIFCPHNLGREESRQEEGYRKRKGKAARLAKEAGTLEDRDKRIAASLDRDKAESQKAAELRRQKRKDMAIRARSKYKEDRKFARLHDSVAGTFAGQLLMDKKALDRRNLAEVSLASKWAPSADKSYDMRTLMYDDIARRIFRKENNSELAALDDEQYLSLIRNKVRKEVLVPLRRALQLPEIFMSANEWGKLPYGRVASVAMTKYVELFVKHDKPRFIEFLESVAEGKQKVAAGALLPHMIVRDALMGKGSTKELLSELQWKRIVNDLKESGSLKGSFSVCDVSGSMSGTPMDVCIALGLLLAELSEEPWKNHVCTFSTCPQIHLIEGESLLKRYEFVEGMDWDGSTNFQLVFDAMLEMAKASQIPAEEMIKRVFVFSDMEFDVASTNPWETDYMVIKKKYAEAGYGEPPEIVFWNLRDSRSTPVLASEKGVALVSGFSKNILKVFLDEGSFESMETEAVPAEEGAEEGKKKVEKSGMDPMLVMQKAISDELFNELRVHD